MNEDPRKSVTMFLRNCASLFLLLVPFAANAGPITIDFEDVDEGPFLPVLTSQGFTFVGSDNPGGFPLMAVRDSPTDTTGSRQIVDSGSRYLVHSDSGQPGFFPTITMTADNDVPFRLLSFDYAEDNLHVAFAERIEVTGLRGDGTMVFAQFALDGIADGLGGLDDFQTAVLTSLFQDLVSVQFFGPSDIYPETKAFSLDNIRVAQGPEPIDIDVKPGDSPECGGVIPVAVLGSESLDVSQIDPSTLSFEGLSVKEKGNGALSCDVEDINFDGIADYVCQYRNGLTQGTLTGELLDGTPIEGDDAFCVKN